MSGRTSAVGELRHTFRTPVNHIVGYTEMLLEDLPTEDEEHRAPLRAILDAAHDALKHISAVLVPSETPAGETVRRLYSELEEPQARILRAVSSLLAAHDLGEPAADDLRRILHAAEQLRPAEVADADRVAPEAAEPVDERPARILVVDDVDDNRQLLKRRLEKQGHAVQCAEDGKRALAMVEAEPPDLVLLDIMMPEMDGFAVLARLKGSRATREIPVIVISALDDTASAVQCIEQGAEDFLPKPFDPVLLKARVDTSITKKRARDRERAYLEAAEQVAAAAAAVEAGTYRTGSLATAAKRGDAVGRLARVFDAMATNVRAREQQLHERVRSLKLDIAKARESGIAAAQALPTTGERVGGRYEVLATLGRGGMGAVFRVRDSELGEEIALKTLRRESIGDAAVLERFKSEIRLARKITHRNVVRTHDLGEFEGGYFLTMELVEGVTVRELIDTRGKLGVESVLAIGTQLADALAAAHAEGVIHRDIKPHNLLLDADGMLKVMDFGVARLSERTSGLTEVGLIVGTPAYMPPEQLLGEEVDLRCDLYAAGVVLFEAVTGKLPFEAATPMALIARLLQEEAPRARSIEPQVPEGLDALLAEMLAKRADERPKTAIEVRDRLAGLG